MLDISNYEAKSLKTEDAILKIATSLGTNALTDVSVMVRFATFLFACGAAYLTNKSNFPFNKAAVFMAFNNAFRSASNGHRKELKDTSIETWVSAFGAYFDAGKWTKYPIADIAEKTMNLEGTSFTQRGAKLRKVMEKFPETAPTEAELDAILNPPEKVDANPMGTLAGRWALTVGDKRVAKNDADAKAQADANPRIRLAWLAVQQAVTALEKACEPVETSSGLTPEQEIAMLKAKLEASNAPTGPTN